MVFDSVLEKKAHSPSVYVELQRRAVDWCVTESEQLLAITTVNHVFTFNVWETRAS